jgi:outer membrane protein TolC
MIATPGCHAAHGRSPAARRRRCASGVVGAAAVLCTATGLGAAPAPDPASLSLGRAVTTVLARHPSLAAAQAGCDAARAATGEARAASYPALRLGGTATQYQEPMLVTPLHGFVLNQLPPFDNTVFQGTLGAGYTLFDGGARGGRIEAAQRTAESAEATRAATAQELAARTVNAYLQVLGTAQVLASQDQRLASLDAELGRARQFRAAGRAADVEVLRAEAAHAAATAERIRLAAVLDVAERDLARLADIPVDSTRVVRLVPVALADTILPERAAILAAARASSPALAQARAQFAAAAANTGVARGARWPDVKLFGNYVGWADDAGHDALEWNAGAALAYPIFSGGAIASNIDRADAGQRGAAAALRLAELQLAQSLDLAMARCEQAHARVASLATAVQRFVEVVRIEKLSLAAGSGTQTDYLRAEADLLEARAGWVEARHGEMSARAELARITGTLDGAWIARTLENEP